MSGWFTFYNKYPKTSAVVGLAALATGAAGLYLGGIPLVAIGCVISEEAAFYLTAFGLGSVLSQVVATDARAEGYQAGQHDATAAAEASLRDSINSLLCFSGNQLNELANQIVRDNDAIKDYLGEDVLTETKRSQARPGTPR